MTVINTYSELKTLIASKKYLFDQTKFGSGHKLEKTGKYFSSATNTITVYNSNAAALKTQINDFNAKLVIFSTAIDTFSSTTPATKTSLATLTSVASDTDLNTDTYDAVTALVVDYGNGAATTTDYTAAKATADTDLTTLTGTSYPDDAAVNTAKTTILGQANALLAALKVLEPTLTDLPSVVGDNELLTVRTELLALNKADLTISELRALIDIIVATDLGDLDQVQLDGSTSKTVAQTIGTDPLITSVKSSLAAAINTAGVVVNIKLDGTTPATDFTSIIGTDALTTSNKASLVDAINAIGTRSDSIVTTGLSPFYGCQAGAQTVKINLPTTTTELEVYNKIAQCIKFAKSSPELGFATIEGGECTPITAAGDALPLCISTIMTVESYS
jgi:hypothetical protein